MSELTESVRNALSQQDMEAVTVDVKRLLCDELARVDPTARIHSTEYFNHTYIPDVVVDWDDQGPREVYLRFVSSPARLVADSERLGAAGPVILDLSAAALPDRDEKELAASMEASTLAADWSPRLLLTDTEATEHIRPETSQNLVERLVVSNVLRGGRGQLNEPMARATVLAAREGFNAAVRAEPRAVRAAAEVARLVLEPNIERRVERSLQLLWWVGGGAPQDFPLSMPDDMELNPADTREFLQMVFSDQQDIANETFWSRLADRLTFEALVEVGNVDRSTNLDRLMVELAGRLKLSHVVLDRQERPLQPFDELAWGLDDNFLRLRGPEWVCRFTPLGNRFSQRRDEGYPIALATAHNRTDGYLVEEAELDETAREVLLSRKAVDPSGERGRSLRDLAVGFGDRAVVRRVTVLAGDSDLTVDFVRMMVGADPDASVLRMATVAVRLLGATGDEDQQELAAFLDGRNGRPKDGSGTESKLGTVRGSPDDAGRPTE